jgi:TolB protein
MKRFRRFLIVGMAVLVIVIVAVIVVIYQQLNKETPKVKTAGELSFMSDRDGNWNIYLRDKAGDLHNLTEASDAHEFFANFTFGGEVLNLYSTKSGEITPATVNADASDFKTMNFVVAMMTALQAGLTDWDPTWSPDGESMVWLKMGGLPPSVDLWWSNADGSDSRNLTDDGATEMMPAWSPDGKQIVYVSDKDGEQNVYLMDVESGNITRLSDHEVGDINPVWSTDGSQILFVAEQDIPLVTGTVQFFLVNPDGSEMRPFTEDDTFAGGLRYSPEGGQVAYMSNEEGSWHIYVMDADGANVRQVTDGNSNNLYPIWRPVPAEEAQEGQE